MDSPKPSKARRPRKVRLDDTMTPPQTDTEEVVEPTSSPKKVGTKTNGVKSPTSSKSTTPKSPVKKTVRKSLSKTTARKRTTATKAKRTANGNGIINEKVPDTESVAIEVVLEEQTELPTTVEESQRGSPSSEKQEEQGELEERNARKNTTGTVDQSPRLAETTRFDSETQDTNIEELTPAERLQRRIGYQFRNLEILRVALTHSSGANHRLESNERLEFLGDAILGEIISVELFRRFPKADEGELTRMKSDVVSRETCAKLGSEIDLGDALFVGKAIAILTEMPMSIPANAMEALIAAIAIDGGRRAVLNFVKKLFWKEIDRSAHETTASNAKSALQQLAQHRYGCAPQYILLDEKGPAHHRAFEVAVKIGNHQFASAWGASKKQTEQQAARNALEAIRQHDAAGEE